MTNPQNTQSLPPRFAGNSSSRPEEFPIGSLASRAAARMLAQEKRRPRKPPRAIIKVTDLNQWLTICKHGEREAKTDYYIQFVWAGHETAAEIESARVELLAQASEETGSFSKGMVGNSSEPSL